MDLSNFDEVLREIRKANYNMGVTLDNLYTSVSENQCEYWWNNSTCYWQIKLEALPICEEERWYIGASYRNAD